LPVYGDGKNVRDWLYVEDHCEAIWTIMLGGKRGETYNVGGASEMENITIVEMICDALDEMMPQPGRRSRRDLIAHVADRPGHDRRYAIDFTKLNRATGWHPQESFETGLRKTIQWYMDHRNWCERIKTGAYRQWLQEHYGQS
jgi:dTDP-glucose 4,6-dehydratase